MQSQCNLEYTIIEPKFSIILPYNENKEKHVDESLHRFQQTIDNYPHAGVVTDEPQRPQNAQQSDRFDEG